MLPTMKSAYELAMERLAKDDPEATRPLTAEKKARLAEVERIHKGKWAEREIFLRQQLESSLTDGKYDEVEKIKKQMADEKARIEEACEDEKNRIRRS